MGSVLGAPVRWLARRIAVRRVRAPRRCESGAGTSPPALPDECWLGALAYLAPRELCACALVPPLRALADDDALWERVCDRRWEGKQGVTRGELFWRGDYSRARLCPGEMKAILARRADGRARASWAAMRERAELEAALDASTPAPRPSETPPRAKWKAACAAAERDAATRLRIARDEVARLRWRLVYHGTPSTRGLRHFREDGVFESPQLGLVRWSLDDAGNFLMHGQGAFPVVRDPQTWGWVIGTRGQIEYHSVEVEVSK